VEHLRPGRRLGIDGCHVGCLDLVLAREGLEATSVHASSQPLLSRGCALIDVEYRAG
jgi:uncharacterized metal-binding protein